MFDGSSDSDIGNNDGDQADHKADMMFHLMTVLHHPNAEVYSREITCVILAWTRDQTAVALSRAHLSSGHILVLPFFTYVLCIYLARPVLSSS